MFVEQYNTTGRIKPRKVAEALLQSVPIPAKVIRKLEALGKGPQKIPLATQPATEPHDQPTRRAKASQIRNVLEFVFGAAHAYHRTRRKVL